MTDKRYDDLMLRRQALFIEWMKRVEAAKQMETRPSFYGTGVVLDKDGGLRITAFDSRTGRGLFNLSLAPFSTEIEETMG
jgi:hypothetical protein